jgi:hypothetical protein
MDGRDDVDEARHIVRLIVGTMEPGMADRGTRWQTQSGART